MGNVIDDEVLLALAKKSGGGSGGTNNYNQLINRPQINGNTLAGNKSAEDLGLAESGDIPTKVSDLDNDVNFISDDDYVHTDNNYDDDAKGIVNGVIEALAGKQDTLTFDNIPTENSTNPVKSGGVYAVDEAIRKWTTAEAKSVSGNPITLTDGSARNAEGLVITCEPVQDLHGYDHPWVGGAGKNKLPMTVDGIKALNAEGTWTGNVYTYLSVNVTVLVDDSDNVTCIKVNGTPSANFNFILAKKAQLDALPSGNYIMNGCPAGGATDGSTYYIGFYAPDKSTYDFGSGTNISLSGNEDASANVYIRIASGYVAENKEFYPMIRLASESDATFAPYSNECPITGLTECVVDRDGKNLLDPDNLGHTTYDITTGQASGTNPNFTSTTNMVAVEEGKTYCLSKDGTMASARKFYYSADGAFVSTVSNNTAFTIPSGVSYFRFHTGDYSGSLTGWQLEQRTAVTPYQPYSHYNVILAFGQTVYGARVNVKTRKATLTHALDDMGELTWSWDGGLGGFVSDGIASSVKKPSTNYQVFNGLCEAFPVVAREGASNNQLFVNTNGRIGVITNMYEANPTTFKTAMSGLHICYELATPIELTLTPAELELLKGYNYITTNGTTIALNYLPDSLLAEAENYVDAKIPPAPSSDGTYVLTCTVTSGIPAYSWESAT